MLKPLVASALVVSSTPALATELAPPDALTLSVRSNLVLDIGLMVEARVNEHFAYNISVGASRQHDELGVNLGVGLKYFVAEDFQGFYVGFGGDMAAIEDEGELTYRSIASAYFGVKWVIGPGLTVDLNVGPSFAYDEDQLPDGGLTKDLFTFLNVQAALGWTF